jgi:hypothetical protein
MYGAYANIAQTHTNKSTEVVFSATKRIYWDDLLQLSVPYQYFWELAGEPPDNAFLAILFSLSVMAIYVAVIGVRLWMLHAQCKNASSKQSSVKKVALTSKNAKEGTNISCSFDTDGIPFVINYSATCIICNDRSQFVGNLRAQESSVETSHETARSNFVDTIRICLTTDEGMTMEYHIPSAIYAPDFQFDILGIPFLGSFLGQDDTPYPTQDDDGTYIFSSASHSHFIWDHGKHKHLFCHDKRLLPILFLETGVNYFGAFCTRVTRLYRDSVHYAFSSAYSIIPDEDTSLCSSKGGRRLSHKDALPLPASDINSSLPTCSSYRFKPDKSLPTFTTPMPSHKGAKLVVTPESDFELVQDGLYTNGAGSEERVVYEGAIPDGLWHTLCRQDSSKIVTPSSNLCFLDQPNFLNIPSTPLEY